MDVQGPACLIVLTLLLVLFVGPYVALTLGIAWVIRRRRPIPPAPESWPEVTVIVPARNEEAVLARCVEALLAQRYPPDRLHLLLVNDQSTDATGAVIQDYARREPRITALDITETLDGLAGKANALHQAICTTSTSVLLTTDADCAPPPDWIRHLVAYLSEDRVGLVCGITLVDADSRVGHIQALDWMWLLATASAFANVGVPVTAMGNNMAFRRSAYEAVGGYPALPFSVTEDYELFRAVHRHPDWQVRLPFDAGLQNHTLPLPTLTDAFRQRKRWARGGLHDPSWLYLPYLLLIGTHVVLAAGLFIAPTLTMSALLFKVLADAIILRTAFRVFGRRSRWRFFLAFEAFCFGYLVTIPLLILITPKIRWKGRTW